ncbi:hypothetical protein ACJX0J_024753, partial [Zea mays]
MHASLVAFFLTTLQLEILNKSDLHLMVYKSERILVLYGYKYIKYNTRSLEYHSLIHQRGARLDWLEKGWSIFLARHALTY